MSYETYSLVTARQHSLLAMLSTVLAIVNPSVRLSVSPSHAGTVSKRLKLRSKLFWTAGAALHRL